jgi:hypothetical protein
MNFFTLLKLKLSKWVMIAGLLTCSFTAMSQKKLPGKALQIMGGYSSHGSGDMKGIVFGTEYLDYVTRKFSLSYSIRATINNGAETIIVNNQVSGQRTDASIRFTTAGVQVGVNGGLSLIRTPKHEFMISLGAFGRYQSASNGSDGYSLYYPQQTGVPTVLVGYNNRTPQKTYAVGGIFQLHHNFTFRDKIYLGLMPGFQTDTNGDLIPYVALSVGRRLR